MGGPIRPPRACCSPDDEVRLGYGCLIPSQRSVMTMASGIATIARLSSDRFRACFGTGSRLAGSRPAPDVAKRAVRLRRYAPPAARRRDRPHRWQGGSDASLASDDGFSTSERAHWLSVMGPRGNARAPEVADGTIGPPHPTLPTATMLSGTVLDPGEDPHSSRVLRAVGPWAVVSWHTAYTHGGAAAVDACRAG